MKKILGLDLGTTSIGWAYVLEAENKNENSKILRLGVRVNPLTTDETKNFTEGKSITTNADRTLKRHARRNLDRFKLRRDQLISLFIKERWIIDTNELVENSISELHETYHLRAKAVNEKLSLNEFARVLLMINKKRGYKSSRKAVSSEDGQHIDGMDLAFHLQGNNLTPGQYAYSILQEGKKVLPSFYRSDLNNEFDRIWQIQKEKYPEILTVEFKDVIKGKSKTVSSKIFFARYGIYTAKNEGKERKITAYKWRTEAIKDVLEIEKVAYVLSEINGDISSSSGYLGAISDRSKILHFNNITVGEYQDNVLKNDKNNSLKNQVFYRQDYMDEFDIIWANQSKYYNQLTKLLGKEIRNKIIFYQRPLKSQKGLISFCEFESKQIEVEFAGKLKTKTIGSRVIPRSSPLFQEFKIWQILNNIEFQEIKTKEVFILSQEQKQMLFDELNLKSKISGKALLKLLFGKDKDKWRVNYDSIEGNKTNAELYKAYERILELEGNDINLSKLEVKEQKGILRNMFKSLGINVNILDFNAELDGQAFIKQESYELWHLLYSFEGDDSKTGIDSLLKVLKSKFGFKKECALILANIPFIQDYGSLSAKAIRKIMPFIKEHKYDEACSYAGYNHSSSLTKEDNEKRDLKKYLDILPKNSLRNPVVEKILNQMINVINAIVDHPDMGTPDEIRIELSRELKKNAKEREKMKAGISAATKEHDKIKELLRKSPFFVKNPTRNDIIKYKLYEELACNGYHTFYTNKYIPKEILFSNQIDIEHIIPKALIFDDSFSNKTLTYRDVNLKKNKQTAIDFIENEYGDKEKMIYIERINTAYKASNGIGKAKYYKLLKKQSEIKIGFIERDLRDSQYIAKKAKSMLFEICRVVTSTTGKITARLREDWDLINVMKELNIDKYRSIGLTMFLEKKDGTKKEHIVDWTKRNDHRHHAMDALTVAFTRIGHIQYLNNLHAKSNKSSSIYGLKNSLTFIDDNNKRRFIPPMPRFRQEAKRHLENILISRKAKNKVVTRNINRIKGKGKNSLIRRIELTPRGQLHKETIYGAIKRYHTKLETIGGKFDRETIAYVAKKKYRELLLERLEENNDNPKKAFTGKNSLKKNPIYLENGYTIPLKVKTVKLIVEYTIRKDITPELKIEKVIDVGIKNILQKRLNEYGNDKKMAFSNLEENPIWLNEKQGISIKRVTIRGVSNVEPLHSKKDHYGKEILDKNNIQQPTDYVSTGNNHHVAIYKDNKGKLQERVVSFFEAVHRVNAGIPIIDKEYNKDEGWEFLFTMKQNEYFIFPSDEFDPSEIDLMNKDNYALINPHLFRVQKISSNNYMFAHHLETQAITGEILKNKKELSGKSYFFIQSPFHLKSVIKIRINHIGEIVEVGEY